MSTLEVTLTNPIHRGIHRGPVVAAGDATDGESSSNSQSFTLAQSIARVTLTLAFMVGLSALFAAQIHATLR